jgi:hypothetical protein
MTTLTTMAGVALSLLSAGILSGALLWRKRVSRRSLTQRTALPAHPLLWDIHSLLNTMNRFAIASERGNAIDPALVYNLSNYLLHSSVLQRQGGWSDSERLGDWLQAHLRILGELRGQGDIPEVTVIFGEDIHEIEADQLIRQVQWFFQRTQVMETVEVHARPSARDRTAIVRVTVVGTMRAEDYSPSDELTSSWQLGNGTCSCEFKAGSAPANTHATTDI